MDMITEQAASKPVRRARRPLRAAGACLVAAAVTLSLPAPPAGAADTQTVLSQGRVWNDGLDTRLQAQSFVSAAQRAGYSGSSVGSQLQPIDWFDRAAGAQAVGFFGHGNEGLFAPADDGAEVVYSGSVDAYNHRVAGDVTGATVNISSYLPQEIDDVRLMIFSSCYSSLRFSDSYYSLPEAARLRGVDAAVAFKGLIYSPKSTTTTPVADTNYSGGYLWNRVSQHLGEGRSISVALTRGLNELYAKEGGYAGYDRYVIEGASASPGAVTLRPLAETNLASGVDAASVSRWLIGEELAVSASNDLQEREIAPRTYARFDSRGRLFDIVGEAHTEGPDVVDRSAAAEVAAAALSDLAAPGAEELASLLEPVTAIQNERVFRLEWTGAAPDGGRRFVSLDIDRRSGLIVRLLNTQGAAPASGTPQIGRDAAVDTARAFAGGDDVLAAVLDDWTGQDRWIVTTVSDSGARVRHEVDADTGRYLRASMTSGDLRP